MEQGKVKLCIVGGGFLAVLGFFLVLILSKSIFLTLFSLLFLLLGCCSCVYFCIVYYYLKVPTWFETETSDIGYQYHCFDEYKK
jgi:DMSO reductase anchor subunit